MNEAPARPTLAPPDLQSMARVKELEARIAELATRLADCEKEAKDLLGREAAGEGFFAPEIFRLKQRKMMLATEIQHRKVRINALLLGM